MAGLIDSSVVIEVERQRRPIGGLVAADDEPDDWAIAAMTAAELLIGVHRADTEARRAGRAAFVEAVLARLPVVPFDLAAARVYARLAAQLWSAGQPVAVPDLLIAAAAIAGGREVVTHNLRDFGRIPGLRLRRLG